MVKGHKTIDEKINSVIWDIRKYMVYLGIAVMGGAYEIRHLPLTKSIDEHPYWLITKLVYIRDRLNTANQEGKTKKGG